MENAVLTTKRDNPWRDNIIPFPTCKVTKSTAPVQARKPRNQTTESLTCYAEIANMSQYFIARKKFRDNALFITGLATGFRISDLVRLRVSDVVDTDTRTFRRVIDIHEQKTGKRTVSNVDEVLITEAMQHAITLYMNAIQWRLPGNEYLFKSRKQNGGGEYRLDESQGYRIIVEAAKAVGINLHIGSHSLKKTFLNIAHAVGSTSKLQGSSTVMTDCQILARHANMDTTLRYMTLTKQRLLSLREGVSAFLMGKTAVKELGIRYEFELDDDDA